MRFAFMLFVATRLAHADAPVAEGSPPGATPPTDASLSPDAAPSRFVVVASTGLGTARIGEIDYGHADVTYNYGERGIVQTLEVDVGVRLDERWMLGVHAGTASKTTFISGWSDFMGTYETQLGVRAIQYGIAAHYAFRPKAWIAPWIGVQDTMRREECYLGTYDLYPTSEPCVPVSEPWKYHFDLQPAVGFTAGIDLLEHSGHRLSLVGSVVISSVTPFEDSPEKGSYSTFSLNVAYRFWR
jgi:hypothetical protein